MPAKGRKPKEVEFIRQLKELSGHASVSDFAKACGKKQANTSNYLLGKNVPGKKVLKDCLWNLFGWDCEVVLEIASVPPQANVPAEPGIYVLYDSGGNVLYIGKATSLKTELFQTLRRRIPVSIRTGPSLDKVRPALQSLTSYVSLYRVRSGRIRHNLEALMLRVFANQTHNSNIGQFH